MSPQPPDESEVPAGGRDADRDQDFGQWHSAEVSLGLLTLRVVYHRTTSDAVFELYSAMAEGTRVLDGTGNLADGITAHFTAGLGTGRVHLSLNQDEELRYRCELTSLTGQHHAFNGALAGSHL